MPPCGLFGCGFRARLSRTALCYRVCCVQARACLSTGLSVELLFWLDFWYRGRSCAKGGRGGACSRRRGRRRCGQHPNHTSTPSWCPLAESPVLLRWAPAPRHDGGASLFITPPRLSQIRVCVCVCVCCLLAGLWLRCAARGCIRLRPTSVVNWESLPLSFALQKGAQCRV